MVGHSKLEFDSIILGPSQVKSSSNLRHVWSSKLSNSTHFCQNDLSLNLIKLGLKLGLPQLSDADIQSLTDSSQVKSRTMRFLTSETPYSYVGLPYIIVLLSQIFHSIVTSLHYYLILDGGTHALHGSTSPPPRPPLPRQPVCI